VTERMLAEDVERHIGERLLSARAMGGGCIGEVYKVELAEGTTLVAKVDREGESYLDREAYMLRYLRERSELPIPEIFYGSETLLLMEFIEGSSRFSEGAERHAAELLAALHGVTAEAYGHERDTLIGSLDQPNPWTESWVEFFRDQYLGQPEQPSLIHGDVWSANVLAEGDRITAFLDPAIYHADPEIELSFISLFNSFGSAFFERYKEIRGIRDGFFEERRDLYNLYPLLVHVYFFGGGYLDSVRATLRRFGL
jgi:fructosamine-3-kinase